MFQLPFPIHLLVPLSVIEKIIKIKTYYIISMLIKVYHYLVRLKTTRDTVLVDRTAAVVVTCFTGIVLGSFTFGFAAAIWH